MTNIDPSVEAARAVLQEKLGNKLRDARRAAAKVTAKFDAAKAATRVGQIYFEDQSGRWLAEAGSFKLPAHSLEQDEDLVWRVTHTIHWPSGTPDAQIVAVWLVWKDMARRIHLAEAIPLRNESADFIAGGVLAL